MDDVDLVSTLARQVRELRLTRQKGRSDMCNEPSNGNGTRPFGRIRCLLYEGR